MKSQGIYIRRKFEQSILEKANEEHISFGSAKRIIMGANTDITSTYASVVRRLKSSAPRRGVKTPQRNPSSSKTVVGNSMTTQSTTGQISLVKFRPLPVDRLPTLEGLACSNDSMGYGSGEKFSPWQIQSCCTGHT